MANCRCGRSPTGLCKGWHGLTDEEFKHKKEEYKSQNNEE